MRTIENLLGPLPETNQREAHYRLAREEIDAAVHEIQKRYGLTSAEFAAALVSVQASFLGRLLSVEREQRKDKK